MGKPRSTEGFTLTEITVVLLVGSLLTLILSPLKLDAGTREKARILSELIHTQASAMWSHQAKTYSNHLLDYEYPIRFTAKGMSTQAQTLYRLGVPFLVIQLGPGRIDE